MILTLKGYHNFSSNGYPNVRSIHVLLSHYLMIPHRGTGYLFRPNRSCHFPFPGAVFAFSGTVSSSTVSLIVEMIEMPSANGSSSVGDVMGERSISAFDVFFWRSAYVLLGVLITAEVSLDSMVRLNREVSIVLIYRIKD